MLENSLFCNISFLCVRVSSCIVYKAGSAFLGYMTASSDLNMSGDSDWNIFETFSESQSGLKCSMSSEPC